MSQRRAHCGVIAAKGRDQLVRQLHRFIREGRALLVALEDPRERRTLGQAPLRRQRDSRQATH
jgi:hypothetical protein